MADKTFPTMTKKEFKEKSRNSKHTMFIIHNSIYDVTKYLDEHPGGELVLTEVHGKNATESFEDVGHSDDAKEIMKDYKIGEIIPGEDDDDEDNRFKRYINKEILTYTMLPIATAVLTFFAFRIYSNRN